MNYLIGACSDIGLKKKTNQDSYCYKVIETEGNERICFSILCDGMGGLTKGEVASATVVKSFSEWIEKRLPVLLENDFSEKILSYEWNRLIIEQNKKIYKYGEENKIMLGTTLTVLLIVKGILYIANVGDTRAYKIANNNVMQITIDHSLVQKEIEKGKLTKESAKNDPRKNILLQCVGAAKNVSGDIFIDKVKENNVYILATDGFWNKIEEEDLYNNFNADILQSEEGIKNNIKNLIELVKGRNEKDNITAIVVKCE